MARTLSLFFAAACSAAMIFGSSLSAQEETTQEEKQKKCQCELRIESSTKSFLIPQIQFKVKFDQEQGENSEPSKIVPMMSGLPVVGTLFKQKRLEVEVDTVDAKDCPKDRPKNCDECCKDGCCDSDKKTCPATQPKCCESCPKFAKTVPPCCAEGCCEGPMVGKDTCCPNGIADGTCCPADHPFFFPGIQLSGHFEPVAPPTFDHWHGDPRLEQMMELRLENERLRVEMAGMKERMKLIERMAEMRAYTAQLEARIAMMNRGSANASYPAPVHNFYPSQPTRVLTNPYAPAVPTWRPAPTNPPCCPNHASPNPNCMPKSTSRSATRSYNAVPYSTVPVGVISPPPVSNHKPLPLRAASVPMPSQPSLPPVKAATPATNKTKPNVKPTAKPPQTSIRLLPSNKIHVPDGGTILFGGSIKRKAEFLPAVPSSYKKPTKPATKNRERELEIQIARLTAEIANLKLEKAHKQAKIQVGVPMSKEWKSFKNVTPKTKKPEKKKSSEEKTFSFHLGTIR